MREQILQLSKYYPPYRGGIELVAKMITKAHRSHENTMSIISFGETSKNYTGEFAEQVYQFKADITPLSTPINFNLIIKLKSLIQQISPDKIYVHLPNPLMHLLISLLYRILKWNNPYLKIYAVYHSDIINQKRLAPIYNFYFRYTCNCYDKIIVACNKLWENSPLLSKLPENKKKIVHYCTDLSITYQQRTQFKQRLVAIGRCVPYKGFDFLIKAINQTNYHLTIIGDGPELPMLKSIANNNITFTGQISDSQKEEILQNSDVLIVSSINSSEAYGLIIVEAFAYGLPVIAANIPSCVTFLAQAPERALNFTPLNTQELLSALRRLEEEPHLLSNLSANAHRFFQEKLSFTAFTKNLLAE